MSSESPRKVVPIVEEPLLLGQDPDQVLVQHLDRVGIVAGAAEGHGGVVADVLKHHLVPAREQ